MKRMKNTIKRNDTKNDSNKYNIFKQIMSQININYY